MSKGGGEEDDTGGELGIGFGGKIDSWNKQ